MTLTESASPDPHRYGNARHEPAQPAPVHVGVHAVGAPKYPAVGQHERPAPHGSTPLATHAAPSIKEPPSVGPASVALESLALPSPTTSSAPESSPQGPECANGFGV